MSSYEVRFKELEELKGRLLCQILEKIETPSDIKTSVIWETALGLLGEENV